MAIFRILNFTQFPQKDPELTVQISQNTVVSINYTLKDDQGQVIDSSEGGDPLVYIHGTGSIIPGLEKELTGKSQGDEFQVRISPEDAYGVRHDNLIHDVPRDQLPEGELTVGMKFQAESEAGQHILTVVAIEGDTIKMDANHPLAGVALNFAVSVGELRAATAEELEHGHVHGQGGHDH